MDNCFCIYNGETDKFFVSFFQLPPIVNWKVTLIIFKKKRHFFVFFFSFSICGRSQKNPFFSTFFEKREKILKSYSKNSCIFDITCGESWHFFSVKMKCKVPIATGTENFEHFQNHQKNTVFWYQITDSTKKVVEKTTFFTSTHC